jgi:hypothetical protein
MRPSGGWSLPRQAGEAQPEGRAGADRHHHDAAAALARAAALRPDAEGGDARGHLVLLALNQHPCHEPPFGIAGSE